MIVMSSGKLEKQMYSIKEACELLQVSDATIRKLIKSGQLDAKKVGIQWRIRRASLEAFLGK